MADPDQHAARMLHDAIQTYMDVAASRGQAPEGAVTKWTLAVEMALPTADKGFASITCDAGGDRLTQWDAIGLAALSIVKQGRDALRLWR